VLVVKYPTDSRAHLFRALYFYRQHDRSDAIDQLRIGIADLPAHADDFKPVLRQTLKMTLAQIQFEEGDRDDARDTARDSCASASASPLLDTLKREQICD
jgi:rhomboid protease GluP